ncbi:hypothetical protein DFH11DRAFT_901859 [Phellopilus nigrolimitatus]|nr:hypothetical protein DFH11DRAFT_901859 [Phellopilus nigrolimitatus]
MCWSIFSLTITLFLLWFSLILQPNPPDPPDPQRRVPIRKMKFLKLIDFAFSSLSVAVLVPPVYYPPDGTYYVKLKQRPDSQRISLTVFLIFRQVNKSLFMDGDRVQAL